MGVPAFTLDIEDGAELATVRPRDGSLLLVERVSPTEVVLRLRPADGSQAASPAALAAAAPASSEAHAAAEAAEVTSEAQPASARSEGGAAETEGTEGGGLRIHMIWLHTPVCTLHSCALFALVILIDGKMATEQAAVGQASAAEHPNVWLWWCCSQMRSAQAPTSLPSSFRQRSRRCSARSGA